MRGAGAKEERALFAFGWQTSEHAGLASFITEEPYSNFSTLYTHAGLYVWLQRESFQACKLFTV